MGLKISESILFLHKKCQELNFVNEIHTMDSTSVNRSTSIGSLKVIRKIVNQLRATEGSLNHENKTWYTQNEIILIYELIQILQNGSASFLKGYRSTASTPPCSAGESSLHLNEELPEFSIHRLQRSFKTNWLWKRYPWNARF